jgi:hypothetical protein
VQRVRDTQETIVDAALRVLDTDGLDVLSMRHVARTLHTSAASLFPLGPNALRYADRVLAILRAGAVPDDVAMVRDYMASLPADRFGHLVHLADHFAADDVDERFELLLDIFVDGLAQRARI